jgi:molecular chaperone IbpA
MNTLVKFNQSDVNQLLDRVNRDFVGFDRFFNRLNSHVLLNQQQAFPPYNIEKLGETSYQISLAVAGFNSNDIAITVEDRVLKIEGKKEDNEEKNYLHKGIAFRSFSRSFNLADDVEVKHANLDSGMLTINLEHIIPEAKKPKMIPINGGEPQTLDSVDIERSKKRTK